MKVDKDKMVKHHFWILWGLCFPLLLVALFLVYSTMSAIVDKEIAALKKNKGVLSSLDAKVLKNDRWVDQQKEKRDELQKIKQNVWVAAWKEQQGLMTWPTNISTISEDESRTFHRLLMSKDFGDPLDEKSEQALRKDILAYWSRKDSDAYLDQVRGIIKAVDLSPVNKPADRVVQFKGGYDKNGIPATIRYVHEWKNEPTMEELWLAQEDLWVQRELLKVIANANATVARFKRIEDEEEDAKKEEGKKEDPKNVESKKEDPKKDEGSKEDEKSAPKADPKKDEGKKEKKRRLDPGEIDHKSFANPYWRLDLSLVQDAKQQFVLRYRVTNLASKVQHLNVRVNIEMEGGVKIPLHVDGEPLAPYQSYPLPPAWREEVLKQLPKSIIGVEQILDWTSAPVKRIDLIELGTMGHRTSQSQNMALKPFPFKGSPAGVSAPAGGGTGFGQPGGPTPGGPAPGGPTPGGPGGPRGDGSPNGLVKVRYLGEPDQVRRLPFGMVIVCEQAHMEDVLAAFANSPLRIQVVQEQWHRFRGDIRPGAAPATKSTPATPPPGRVDPPLPGGPVAPATPPRDGKKPLEIKIDSKEDSSLIQLGIYGISSLYQRPTEMEKKD